MVDVINLGEQKVRHGGQEGSGPADQRDQAGSSDVGQGEDVERRADGQVALQGERLTEAGYFIVESQYNFTYQNCHN